MSRDARVVVVGGGISGLVAAWDLALAGADVLVLEASGRVGGSLATATLQGVAGPVTVDTGAESFLARRSEVPDLMQRLGATGDLTRPEPVPATVLRDRRAWPLPRRTLYGVPADPHDLTGLLDAGEVARAAAEVRLPLPRDVTVAELIGARMGPAVTDRVVDPLLGGVYAGSAASLSAEATLPQLASAVRAGATLAEAVAAVLDRGGATGSGGESLPAVTPGPAFGGVVGGVGRLADLLARAVEGAGGRIRTGQRVSGLTRVPGGWRVDVADGAGGAGEVGEVAAGVVIAVPAPVAGRLLDGAVAQAAAILRRVRTADVAVVALTVPAARVAAAVTRSTGVLVPQVEGRSAGLGVKAVTHSTTKWGWVAAQDPATAVLRASVGRAGDPGACALADERLVARVVADLTVLAGAPVPVVDAAVQRWPGSLPQYDVGHRGAMSRVRACLAAEGGLALAGNVLDGVGLPACIASGRAAAAALTFKEVHR